MKNVNTVFHFLMIAFIILPQSSYADINHDSPPFVLTLDQVKSWKPNSSLADVNNRSHIALAKRFPAPLNANRQLLDTQVKVLVAPDGMNNFGNYTETQNKFNLYNFTHWSQIDTLNWFAGTATETVHIPAKPWIDAAHKNGVKVIGTVYLAVNQYGGKIETVASLLEGNHKTGFPVAHQLIRIAQYYGFDGWLINQETDLTQTTDAKDRFISGKKEHKEAKKLAEKIQGFMAYLTQTAPPSMEIHWYDSMLADGSIHWQNQLNDKNAIFLQNGPGETNKISDALFINYGWNADMLRQSHLKAKQLKRSPYELYFGADLWPKRDAQKVFEKKDWLHWLFPDSGQKALSSIALFANNFNFNYSDKNKTSTFSYFQKNENNVRSFYDAETRLFAGDDLNIYTNDAKSNWPGIARYVPAKSVLSNLPFYTSFNTGHGQFNAVNGKKVSGPWHNIGHQDVLPTWQFAIKGDNNCHVFFDFDTAYHGGSSLKLQGDLIRGKTSIPLYETKLLLKKESTLTIVYQQPKQATKLYLLLEMSDNTSKKFMLKKYGNSWSKNSYKLNQYHKKIIKRISFVLDNQTENTFSANIGLIRID